jgi:glycosyltransferase involved in cell wall biosynthesis
MDITIVHFGALQPGGYPPDTRALAAALGERNHDVTLIAEDGPRRDGLGSAEVVEPKDVTGPVAADVVHMMGLVRPFQVRHVKRMYSATPLVVSPLTQLASEHMQRSRRKKRLYFPFLRRSLAGRPLSVHGFSNLELAEVDRFLSPLSTFVAPSGVFDPPDVRWNGTGGYMLFFGRNDVHQKGLDLLLEGYARYRTGGGVTPLVIAGQAWGTSRRVLEQMAVEGVRLHGEVQEEEKWDLLARARSLFFLSRWDGPPRPIREALSIGCPVVVTPGTHMADVVDEYSAGRSVRFDGDAVATAMAATDDDRSVAAAADGALRLRERLSWGRVAADYEAGFEQAIEAFRGRSRVTSP